MSNKWNFCEVSSDYMGLSIRFSGKEVGEENRVNWRNILTVKLLNKNKGEKINNAIGYLKVGDNNQMKIFRNKEILDLCLLF